MKSLQAMCKDRSATIVGLGRSAVGAAILLARYGARPFVTDAASGPIQQRWGAALSEAGLPYETGGHTARAWDTAELVVLSPGVPPSLPALNAMREQGVPVMGELEMAAHFTQVPIIAVTGTNGKTTVTELVHHLLGACGHRSVLAGNNHTSFSAALCGKETPDYYVLEVSSYQLETAVMFRPWIGAALNLTPDHLGRHGTMETYGRVKARIFGPEARGASFGVLNIDDPLVCELSLPEDMACVNFTLQKPVVDGIYLDGDTLWVDGARHGAIQSPLPGKHNRANVAAALAIMHAGGFDLSRCLEALPDFSGVEHRLEPLGASAGRHWINDSKSTNVDSLRVALEAFEEPVVLIAGGQGKGSGYGGLRSLLKEHVMHLVAYGAEGPLLEEAFGDLVPATVVRDLPAAVQASCRAAAPGDTVLLSPGCASFDQYQDFEERGAHFKSLVAALEHEELTR